MPELFQNVPMYPSVHTPLIGTPLVAVGCIIIGNKAYEIYKGAREGYFRLNQHGQKVYLNSGQVARAHWF